VILELELSVATPVRVKECPLTPPGKNRRVPPKITGGKGGGPGKAGRRGADLEDLPMKEVPLSRGQDCS